MYINVPYTMVVYLNNMCQKKLYHKLNIRCLTFNHAPYIRETLDGFAMQKTDFPFVAVIVDDASTDGTQVVLQDYLNQHFCMSDAKQWETEEACFVEAVHKENPNCSFAVVLLKYNFYSIGKSKRPIFEEWEDGVSYTAWCEGDDYWIDDSKLQKQVTYLESHPEIAACAHAAKIYSQAKGRFTLIKRSLHHDGMLDTKDVIRRGGEYITTNSLLFRNNLLYKKEYPPYFAKCLIGDYPLQIYCSLHGGVYYIDEVMSVYRADNVSSWCGNAKVADVQKKINTLNSVKNMLKGFAKDHPKWSTYLNDRCCYMIVSSVDPNWSKETLKVFDEAFKEDILHFSFFWKVGLYLAYRPIRGLSRVFRYMTQKYRTVFESIQ